MVTIKTLLKFFLFMFSPFIVVYLSMMIHVFILYLKGKRIIKGDVKTYYEPSFIKKILFIFPKRWALDFYERDPFEFNEMGVHFVAGKQGTGKTMFVTYYIDYLQKKYQKAKVITNYNYVHQHGQIEKWQDLVYQNNGIYGMIKVIDELQNWFSSNQSKDFPPEMLSEITQQRKQRSMILATGQVFGRVAKQIREQVHYIYYPYTFFGSLTIVLKYEPLLNDAAEITSRKFRKLFIVPHTHELRNNYDTYKKILDVSSAGFHERNWDEDPIPLFFEKRASKVRG